MRKSPWLQGRSVCGRCTPPGRTTAFWKNTGGVYRGYRKDFYPGAWLLGEWNKLGGRALITADAHDTAALTFGF